MDFGIGEAAIASSLMGAAVGGATGGGKGAAMGAGLGLVTGGLGGMAGGLGPGSIGNALGLGGGGAGSMPGIFAASPAAFGGAMPNLAAAGTTFSPMAGGAAPPAAAAAGAASGAPSMINQAMNMAGPLSKIIAPGSPESNPSQHPQGAPAPVGQRYQPQQMTGTPMKSPTAPIPSVGAGMAASGGLPQPPTPPGMNPAMAQMDPRARAAMGILIPGTA